MPTLQEEFGRMVLHHRKRQHLTQQELAERSGRSLEMIGRIERGGAAPSFDTIEALSEALETPARDFFGAGSYASGKRGGQLGTIVAKLAPLKPDELVWMARLIDVALKRVRE